MSEEKQDFLRRWSRLKKESAAVAPVSPPSRNEIVEKPVELPPLDSLTFDSDFKAFMHAKVEERVKRAALKKLFADPRFNVMDGLDTYIDDYSIENPIPDEMMARLDHARQALFGHDEEKEEAKAPEETPEEKPEETANSDGNPAQDPKAL
jgi:hypothetical protein